MPRPNTRRGTCASRSSIACHLITYNSYEQADSIKKCLLLKKADNSFGTADIPKLVVTLYTEASPRHTKQVSWLQDHRFFSPFSCCAQWDTLRSRSSVTVTGSLRTFTWFPLLTILKKDSQHFICSLWNYTDIILSHLWGIVNAERLFIFLIC